MSDHSDSVGIGLTRFGVLFGRRVPTQGFDVIRLVSTADLKMPDTIRCVTPTVAGT